MSGAVFCSRGGVLLLVRADRVSGLVNSLTISTVGGVGAVLVNRDGICCTICAATAMVFSGMTPCAVRTGGLGLAALGGVAKFLALVTLG